MTNAHRPAVRVLAAAVAVVGATALSGCVESNRPAEDAAGGSECPFEADPSVTSSVRIAYQNIPNGDLVVKDQKMLENCMPNAKITWNKFDSGGDVIQAFGSNSADIGLIGSSPATKALSAPLNIPMKVIWVHDVIGKAESLVVKDKAITDINGCRARPSPWRSAPPRTTACCRRCRTRGWIRPRTSRSSIFRRTRCRRPGRAARSTPHGCGIRRCRSCSAVKATSWFPARTPRRPVSRPTTSAPRRPASSTPTRRS